MRQFSDELLVVTKARGFYEITEAVEERLARWEIAEGLATLHIRHTSASLVIQENADPTVREDFERFFARLVPDGDRLFRHDAEGPDDMPAHIRAALTAVNLSIPIHRRRMVLGTWQGIYVWEHRSHGHRREVFLHALGE